MDAPLLYLSWYRGQVLPPPAGWPAGGLLPSLPTSCPSMSAPTSPAAARLADAGQQLHEQLCYLEASSQHPAPVPDLGGLLAALDDYARAVLACLPPATAWQDNPHPTPAELLAEREAEPLYRLGWVRGYQQGKLAGQRPAPLNTEALMQQARRLLTELQQRYGAGPTMQDYYSPGANHFRPMQSARALDG